MRGSFTFEQPCGYTLKDIARSKKIILGCGLIRENMDFPGDDGITHNPDEYQKWRKVFEQYFIVKKRYKGRCGNIERKIISERKNSLGFYAEGRIMLIPDRKIILYSLQ